MSCFPDSGNGTLKLEDCGIVPPCFPCVGIVSVPGRSIIASAKTRKTSHLHKICNKCLPNLSVSKIGWGNVAVLIFFSSVRISPVGGCIG